jgi:hypothetical protein
MSNSLKRSHQPGLDSAALKTIFGSLQEREFAAARALERFSESLPGSLQRRDNKHLILSIDDKASPQRCDGAAMQKKYSTAHELFTRHRH